MILLSLLLACSPSVSSFQSDFPVSFCAYAVPCAEALPPGDADTGVLTTADCEAEVGDTLAAVAGDEGCTYDGAAAQACLDALTAADSCSAAESVRDACEDVFTGDACDLHLSEML